jgi:hypothetical protein
MLARGGGEITKNVFPDIPKKVKSKDISNTFLQAYENFAGHIKNFSLTSRNFRKDTIIFSEHIKIFPKFLCFVRTLLVF